MCDAFIPLPFLDLLFPCLFFSVYILCVSIQIWFHSYVGLCRCVCTTTSICRMQIMPPSFLRFECMSKCFFFSVFNIQFSVSLESKGEKERMKIKWYKPFSIHSSFSFQSFVHFVTAFLFQQEKKKKKKRKKEIFILGT